MLASEFLTLFPLNLDIVLRQVNHNRSPYHFWVPSKRLDSSGNPPFVHRDPLQ